ncbi:MAG: SCO family protein [Anaerolineae bacterium]|nr:SCO family protein [Anaerolineae bacterium]
MTENPSPPTPSRQNRLMLLGTLLMGIVGTWVIVFILTNRPGANPDNSGSAAIIEGQPFDGVQPIDPPRAVQDFTLLNQAGEPTALSSFRGKPTILFFGFTNCPDVCPLTLVEYAKLRQILGDQIHYLFISVDPQQDTAPVIAGFLARFDPAIVGLVGDFAVFEQIKADYGLEFVQLPKQDGAPGEYTISHTPNAFLLDAEGRMVAEYYYGTEAQVIADDIRGRLAAP